VWDSLVFQRPATSHTLTLGVIFQNETFTMNRKIIKYFFTILVFVLPIYIYFTPPTDSDGGPMLAYNFLFFYPILLVSTIISLTLIIIGLKNFKNNKIENSLILASTLPTISLLLLVFVNISRIQSVEQYEEKRENKSANEIVKINDELTINLEGYTFEEIRKKVTFTPNKEKINYYTSNQFVQGSYDSFYLYYKVINDSLEIYIPNDEPLYFTNDGLKKLPLKVIYNNETSYKKDLKKFGWK